MKLKNALACTFAALAVVGGGTGTAQAADDDTSKIDNSTQVLSCSVVEIFDQPNLAAADGYIDCSETVEEKAESAHVVGTVGEVLLPRHHEDR
ncbi:hypothetical protein RND61_28130 [Streptomyces sp. TRM76323]|uniref:Secreted protein n=1 Tax=Streptomyces tamarix TaxID=3078565 RepID=A0ABU3QT79_9ACTN|nr:hypothetical protein [Streptomyces tamarix]MDT9685907.1 hypothetical protein [Streptomyces tamarix]